MHALIAILGLAAAQTAARLPDMARQVRAERARLEASGPVFNNENVALRAAVVSTGRAPAPGAPAARPAPGGRDEPQWRALFAEARATIAHAEDRARLREQEIAALNYRLLTESGLYNREGRLGVEIREKRTELDAALEDADAARRALRDLAEELRRAGGPAGWAR